MPEQLSFDVLQHERHFQVPPDALRSSRLRVPAASSGNPNTTSFNANRVILQKTKSRVLAYLWEDSLS